MLPKMLPPARGAQLVLVDAVLLLLTASLAAHPGATPSLLPTAAPQTGTSGATPLLAEQPPDALATVFDVVVVTTLVSRSRYKDGNLTPSGIKAPKTLDSMRR